MACASLKESPFSKGNLQRRMGALPAGVSANHILYIRNLRPITSTRFQLTKRVDVIGQFASWQQQNLLLLLSYFWDFWIEKSDSGEAIKRVVERIRSTKPSRFLVSNMTIRSSNFCYHKIFLKDVYTLDRFTLVFLSVYIFQPSIVRMQKVRLLTDWDSMLGHTKEADEVFKNNSEQQDKWMSCSWFTNPPKTGIDRLNQFRIFRLIFLKANC